jgi:hypothetical protein
MVIAAGLAGALIGGALFSWGTTAMMVGWMVGSWLYGLASPASEGGMVPNEMPMLNQALRGTPIFVTFGTNRVSAQIVWAKNWTATRKQAGGKGKGGGGSGGGGAGKGGAAGYNYDYSTDLMYNYGMFDQASVARRGWVGGDFMSRSTLASILATHPDPDVSSGQLLQAVLSRVYHFRKQVPEEGANLTFTECFFASGYTNNHVDLDNWTYFQQQEGVVTAWPNSLYIGFKTLELGTAGIMPQLSFEFSPLGAAQLDPAEDGFLNKVEADDIGSSTSWGAVIGNNTLARGDDARHYVYQLTNNAHAVYCVETDVTFTIDATWIADRFIEAGGTAGTAGVAIHTVPGKPYLFLHTFNTGANFDCRTCRVYINTGGTFVGQGLATGLATGLPGPIFDARSCIATSTHMYLTGHTNRAIGTQQAAIWRFPLTGNVIGVGVGAWDSNFVQAYLSEMSDATTGVGDVYDVALVVGAPVRENGAGLILEGALPPAALWTVTQQLVDLAAAGQNDIIDAATTAKLIYSANATTYSDVRISVQRSYEEV